MTDAEFQAQRQRIQQAIDKWQELLWLNPWRLKHTYNREPREGDSAAGGIVGRVVTQWEYLSADFDWYPTFASQLPDDELDEYVAHELLHVVVAEMAKGLKKDRHEERVVTHLARVLRLILEDANKATRQANSEPAAVVSQEAAE